MPVSRDLQDVVDLLGQFDERYQRRAIAAVMRIVNTAEEDAADSHLSRSERRAVRQAREEQRAQQRRWQSREQIERLLGKAEAGKLQTKMAELERRRQHDRRDLGLD